MATNGVPQPYEVRCASLDKFSSPIVDVAATVKEARDKVMLYHEETHTSLNRLGVFDALDGLWVDMPRILSS